MSCDATMTSISGPFGRYTVIWGPMLGAALLVGCASARPEGTPSAFSTMTTDEERCAGMEGVRLTASAFALPTGGAVIDKAAFIAADSAGMANAYCKLSGTIEPAVSTDLPIHFQLNLPAVWNGKAVQFGGAGSNGVVVTGLTNTPHAPSTAPSPIMRGYATFGGDSGHRSADVGWVYNAQAYANFAGESVKRTRDAAVGFIRNHYSKGPQRTYFMGGSKGGHEGLVAAQRYGTDYDGVIAYYPAAAAFAMQASWGRMGYAVQSNAAARISVAQRGLVKERALKICDALDGAADGIISNIAACRAAFTIDQLRCPKGTPAGETCLSDAQVAGLKVAATPMKFDFPLAGGLRSIGPYPVLEGGDFENLLYNDRSDFWGGVFANSGDDMARQISGDRAITWPEFDYRKFRPQVERLSTLYDAADTNLDNFSDRGGKLILIQGTTDMLVPEDLTTHYWLGLRAHYDGRLDRFARYYVLPGFGHAMGDFLMTLDSLTLLEKWVEKGIAPRDLVTLDANPKHAGRTRPLCEYPKWPSYRGNGDIQNAASFECVAR